MAKTFTLTSKSYDGRYMKLTCTQKSNGSTKNSSTITWKLETIGGNTELYSTGATKVIINGTTVYSKARVSWSSEVFPASLGSVTGTLTVSHDNEGNLTIPVEFSTAIYTSTVSEYSDDWELDSIPRYATVNQSVVSKTETSITMKWTSDSTVDYIWYTTNDSTWYGLDVADGTSGTYTINNLTPNTTYNVKTKVNRKDSQLETISSKLAVTTYNYPYCTETPSFKVGEKLKITLANPLKHEVTVKLIGNNNYVLATDIISGTTIEGYVTDKFIDNCYYSLPNNSKGNYKVEVTYGDIVKTTDNKATYELDPTLNTPVFTTIGYYDYDAEVVAVTGNQNVLVQGKSTLWGFVRVADKMVAQKGATPVKYVANFEGVRAEIGYSETNDVILAMGVPSTIGTKRLIVDAYDSRGFYTRAYLDVPVISYTKPTVNIEVARLNNFEETTTLKISGTYDKLVVDGASKNSITAVDYRYKETDGTWSEWATAKATLSNGEYTCNDVVLALDSAKSFNIEVRATDKLDYNIASGSVDVGVALFFISTSDKKCYINDKQVMTGKAEDINRTDLNIYTNEFVAGYGHNLTNAPSGTDLGHLMSIPRHDEEGYVTQLFSPYTTDDFYIRKCDAGTWGDWKRLIKEDEFGNVESNTKTEIGVSSAGTSYIQNTRSDGKRYRPIFYTDNMGYQIDEGNGWSDVWKMIEASWGANGYVKFANGFCIQWKYASVTAGGTAWGNVYYSDHSMGNWAIAFTNIYFAKAGLKSNTYWCSEAGWSTTSAGTVRCFRPNNSTGTVEVRIFAFGRWK